MIEDKGRKRLCKQIKNKNLINNIVNYDNTTLITSGWVNTVCDLKIKSYLNYRDDSECIALGGLFDVHMLVAALNNIHSYSPFANQIFDEYKFGLNIDDLFDLN
eukprot:378927_1